MIALKLILKQFLWWNCLILFITYKRSEQNLSWAQKKSYGKMFELECNSLIQPSTKQEPFSLGIIRCNSSKPIYRKILPFGSENLVGFFSNTKHTFSVKYLTSKQYLYVREIFMLIKALRVCYYVYEIPTYFQESC